MNKQPFYHQLSVLFTATANVSDTAERKEFKQKLAAFLKKNLGSAVLVDSVELEACTAEPGDPADLMGDVA